MRHLLAFLLVFLVSSVLGGPTASAFVIPGLGPTKPALASNAPDIVLEKVVFVKRKDSVKLAAKRVRSRMKTQVERSLDQLTEVARIVGEYAQWLIELLHERNQQQKKEPAEHAET